MKKAFFLLLALLFLLTTSCSTTPKPPKTLQNLHPDDWIQTNIGDNSNFVETEDGCYYLNFGQVFTIEDFIYFSPRGSTAFYPLCNKPNCTHNDTNCNAYTEIAFGYYNGALYGIATNQTTGRHELVKMDLDGSNRTSVATLPVMGNYAFHQGKLYIYAWGSYESMCAEDLDRFVVMDLNTYEYRDLLTDFIRDGNRLSYRNFVGDKIYAFASNVSAPDLQPRMIEIDIPTDTWRELVSLWLGASYATETTFYYLEPDVGFREYDLATGEIKNCGLPIEDAWWAAYDEDYIYLMGHGRNDEKEHTLYFLNRNYEYLDQVELTDGIFYGYVSSDKLYFSKDFEPLSHYISKSDIGSHKLSLQPFD